MPECRGHFVGRGRGPWASLGPRDVTVMSPQVMVDTDSSDEDGASSDYRASKWLRARPRAVPEDALILTSAASTPWKVVQMTQPEFVDSQVYFDALVLKYLS